MRRLIGVLSVSLAMLTACDVVGPVEEVHEQQDLLSPDVPELPDLPDLPEGTGPGRTDDELTFAQYATGFGPAVPTASITVVAGVADTLVVEYAGLPNEPPLLEFEVGATSLLLHEDGTPVRPGDLVTITVTLDPTTFKFIFEPSGLTFSPADPARLRLNYAHADLNGDGLVDFLDSVLEGRYRIWRQELPTLPWIQIPTLRQPGDVVEGRVTHFTGFAYAS